ncbi:unnamed protein product [Closterium sp. Yama58-4]|nr:unnamed protein product [Closterium sp. Yama58-4]
METVSAESHTLDHRLLDAIHGSEGGYNVDDAASFKLRGAGRASSADGGERRASRNGDVSSLIEIYSHLFPPVSPEFLSLAAMARKRKTTADAATDVPRDLNEIPYITWINKQIAAGRKPGGPLPEGLPSPGATSFEAPRDVPTRGRRDSDMTRNQMPVKRSVWSPLESTISVAARWFIKDEIESLLGKQGSQYWARLVHHMEKENPGWVRGVNAVQKQWRNLVQFYKQLKKAEKASGKGTVCKPPWFPYMELYLNNRAVANPHAVAAGGATNVNAPCGFTVPSTSAPTTSTPTFTAPPPQCTPPSKRPRASETATMAAAKLICETIKGCHDDAMCKLEGLVRVWMQQDERIARERLQQSAPAPPARNGVAADAPSQTTPAATDGGDDGWFRRGQTGDTQANPDEAEEVWVRGDAE